MDNTMKIVFPTDEDGIRGRECPNCGNYFKVKVITKVPTTDNMCPYCGHKGSELDF